MGIRVEEGKAVRITYRLSDLDGRLLEERTPENPYDYVQGSGAIVAPIERALEGKTVGYQTELTIAPRDGYGEYNPALVVEVPRSALPREVAVEVGMKFNTTSASGEPMTVRVVEVEDKFVTIDGNHPLAGLDLVFEIRLLDVRDDLKSFDTGEPPKVGVILNKRTRGDVH